MWTRRTNISAQYMPSFDETPRGNISFLKLKDLPRRYGTTGDDVRTRVATTTIHGIVLYAILEEQSEYPDPTTFEDYRGETWSAARADYTRSQAPSSRQEQGTLRGSSDALRDLGAAISCPIHHLVVQFTPDAQATDPGKTFWDSVFHFNPRKLTVGLYTTQWFSIECFLESLPHRTTHFLLRKLIIAFLNDRLDAHEDELKLKTTFQEATIPKTCNFNAIGERLGFNIHFTSLQATSAIVTRAPQSLVEAALAASIQTHCEFMLCCQ